MHAKKLASDVMHIKKFATADAVPAEKTSPENMTTK